MNEFLINANGRDICVCQWSAAKSPIVLCVHGVLDHALVWEPVAAHLTAIGKRVIAFDMRGHGKSFHAPGYSIYDFMADLGCVFKSVCSQPVILVGHSLGAMIALMYTALHKGFLILGLVVIEPVVIAVTGEKKGSDLKRSGQYNMPCSQKHPVFSDVKSAADHLRIFRSFLDKDFAEKLATRILKPANHEGFTWTWDFLLKRQSFMDFGISNFNSEFYEDLVSRIHCPIIWVRGKRSKVNHRVDLMALNQIFRNSIKYEIEGGHHLHIESPEMVANIIANIPQILS
jgi:pimeloyl-ACP methyl ester carboxylesterase